MEIPTLGIIGNVEECFFSVNTHFCNLLFLIKINSYGTKLFELLSIMGPNHHL